MKRVGGFPAQPCKEPEHRLSHPLKKKKLNELKRGWLLQGLPWGLNETEGRSTFSTVVP